MQLQHAALQKRRRWFKFRLKIYSVFALFALINIGAAYLLRESSFFKIKSFAITGIEENRMPVNFRNQIKASVLGGKIAKLLGAENYLSWPRKIELPSLEFSDLKVNKRFMARSIEIVAEKREKFGIWCVSDKTGGEQCFWFDAYDGTVIQEAPNTEGSLIFKILESDASLPALGHKVLTFELFQNLKNILIGVKNLGIQAISFEIEKPLQELKVRSREETSLIFSLRFNPNPTIIPGLKRVLNENSLLKIEYLDLTVENKIFLKPR